MLNNCDLDKTVLASSGESIIWFKEQLIKAPTGMHLKRATSMRHSVDLEVQTPI